jgi:hypothetical protein
VRSIILVTAALMAAAVNTHAADFDAAAAFGARPSVSDFSLSPDGRSVSYVSPSPGQGSVLFTMSLEKDAWSECRIQLKLLMRLTSTKSCRI